MMNIFKLIFVSAGIFLISTACSANADQYDSMEAPLIHAEYLYELRDSEEILFGWISDVKMASNGNILVADATRQKIHLFNPDGEFTGSALNEGRGPGEVQRMAGNISITDDDEVVIYDSALRRISLYEQSGNNLDGIRDINLEPFPGNFHVTTEGKVILYVTASIRPEDDPKDRIMVANLNGDIVNNNLIQFEPNEQLVIYNQAGQPLMSTSSPHHSKNLIGFSGDKLIYNRSDEIGFKIYDLDSAEWVTEISFNRPDQPLSSDERRAFVDDLVERAGAGEYQKQQLASEMPTTKGKVRMLKYDGFTGHIWLNSIDDSEPDWLIFSENGDLIATFNENFDGNIISIQNRRIFVNAEDEEGAPMLKVLQHNLNL